VELKSKKMLQFKRLKAQSFLLLLLVVLLSQVSFSQFERTYYSLNPDDPGKYIIETAAGLDGKTLVIQYTHILHGPINWRKNLLVENGNITKVSFTDTLGNLKDASSVQGHTPVSKFKYDDSGRKIAESYWKTENRKTNYYNEQFHALTFTYDSISRKASTSAYTLEDSLICTVRYQYEKDAEQPTEFSYHNKDGSLMKIPIAKVEMEYDRKGRISKKTFSSNTGLGYSDSDVKMIRYKYKFFQMKLGGQVSSSRKVIKFYNADGKKIDSYLSVNFGPPGSDFPKYMEIINFIEPENWLE